ncbi:putative ORFan [Tupanvirus deep ocean]|uniref:ORFan n=2 Tax=Tupanvirus TaxID=2094720 RepID=A0AC62A7K0_9VIRU|nr:putative ORFan [Tupanvirus deep ocean]QKU33767.1 putative ORFan [Tupanvirus deep ocean]
MDQVIKYISEHPNIQDEIISSGNEAVIEALYYLMMHDNYSVEYYLKALFHHGFEKSGIYFFRESMIEFTIISDYINKFGGNFNVLSSELAEMARIEKTSKLVTIKKEKDESPSQKRIKKEKIIASKAIDIIDRLLVHSMSDLLVDFCSHVCMCLNSHYKSEKDSVYGEKLTCSFIFFRIITPKTIKNASEIQLPHVLPLVKILNTIALGDIEKESHFAAEHEKIRNIVARILMKRKDCVYNKRYNLSSEMYNDKRNILVTELRKNSKKYEGIDCIRESILEKKETEKVTKKGIISQSIVRSISAKYISYSPITKSLEDLLDVVTEPFTPCDAQIDSRYFLLWSIDDVLSMASVKELNIAFLKKWKIDGKNFMQLTRDAMHEMGLENTDDITKILKCIENIKSTSITNEFKLSKRILTWSHQDLCLWLIFSGMEHLVDIFNRNKITSLKLLKMNSDMYYEYGITKPRDIIKLTNLKKQM